MSSERTPDVLVLGSGPNGLVAAAYLARAGMRVLVLEASDQAGGACRSAEVTLPGYVHDLGAAFFPFASASPALLGLDLAGAGLVFKHAAYDSAHPAPDGTCAAITRLPELFEAGLGADAAKWQRVIRWFAAVRPRLLDALLGPLPGFRAFLRAGPRALLPFARIGLSSGGGLARSWFGSEAARRVIPGLALHTDVGPDDAFGAAVGFMLAALAATSGFPVPEGGTSAIPRALLRRIEEHGGSLRTGARVDEIVVRSGRAVAVRVGGEELEATRAIVADLAAPTLYRKLLDPRWVPHRVLQKMGRFRHGFGTFKLDWALDAPVPWRDPLSAQAAVVHAGDSLADLSAFTQEVRAGKLPTNPYLVIGQQSLLDPTRAPAGRQTLWAYSRVPFGHATWAADREAFADRIEERIEGLAPGFRKHILARAIYAPPDLEAMNANLLGGDLGGGSAQLTSQLFFRPIFPYFRYRTPVEGLYLGSSYAHPGAGVHGAAGRNAALAVLADVG